MVYNGRCKSGKVKTEKVEIVGKIKIPSKNIEEKGRIQWFIHSSLSELPVRDVTNEDGRGHKTEPHIEIEVENYLSECYQSNISGHLDSDEKYLFLVTRCLNKNMEEYGKNYFVGYMIKEEELHLRDEKGNEWKAVKGKTFIYPFNKALLYYEVYPTIYRLKKVDEKDTKKILNHFKHKHNILQDCIKEIIRLDEKNENDNKTCIVLRGGKCEYEKECLRWNYER